MEYRSLGRTGVKVSPLCLGTFNFGRGTPEKEGIRITHKALDAGINFIDTANRYHGGESERIVGKALANGKREKVVLATKFQGPMSEDPNDQGVSRRHIIHAVEDSLTRLQTDWIDLYQIHRPLFEVPQEETLGALDDLVRQGKIRYIGSSSYPAWMVMEALAISEKNNLATLITEQPPYNLLDRRIENELVPLARRYNIGLITWSPLANGILAGRYKHADQFPEDSRASQRDFIASRVTHRALKAYEEFSVVAQDLEMSPAQLALLWLLNQPAVTAPIVGPRREAHLDDVLPVLEMVLDPSAPERLDQIVPPGSAVVDYHNTHGWVKMKLDF